MESKKYQVAIIGGGPAGMSAAIYCAREGIDFILISGDYGGQVTDSWEVENYLGFSKANGPDLVKAFQEHLKDFEFDKEIGLKVDEVEKENNGFKIKAGKKELLSKVVLIATGRKPKKIGAKGEDELYNKGVSYCAVCDGPLFQGKEVAIIGGGNAALETVLYLKNIAKKTDLLNINPQFGPEADPVLADKVKGLENTQVIFNADTKEFFGNSFLEGLRYQQVDEMKELKVAAAFVEIGANPTTDFVKDLVELNEKKEIVIDDKNMSSQDGLFAAGDVTSEKHKQIIVAAGEGAKAALEISDYLNRIG